MEGAKIDDDEFVGLRRELLEFDVGSPANFVGLCEIAEEMVEA